MKTRSESVLVILASICHCHVMRMAKAEGTGVAEEASTETFKAEVSTTTR